MIVIEPKVEELDRSNPFILIENAGRTCYKSESNITCDSAKKFVSKLIQNKHVAMIEHATFVFEVNLESLLKKLKQFKYLTVTNNHVSGNARAINETRCVELLTALNTVYPELVYSVKKEGLTEYPECYCRLLTETEIEGLDNTEKLAHCYKTFRITTDRGVTHELVRHREFSYAQESTRYVNYSKTGPMKFILPANFSEWSYVTRNEFLNYCQSAEEKYIALINLGMTPQQARAVLPNAIKTEIIMTGSLSMWKHFLDLRYYGKTGKPHPDMQVIANMIYSTLRSSDEIQSIMELE